MPCPHSRRLSRYAPEKIEYGIKRYQNETSRLYSVFEGQLEKNGDWLVGDKYSIVDINGESSFIILHLPSVFCFPHSVFLVHILDFSAVILLARLSGSIPLSWVV